MTDKPIIGVDPASPDGDHEVWSEVRQTPDGKIVVERVLTVVNRAGFDADAWATERVGSIEEERK